MIRIEDCSVFISHLPNLKIRLRIHKNAICYPLLQKKKYPYRGS